MRKFRVVNFAFCARQWIKGFLKAAFLAPQSTALGRSKALYDKVRGLL